MGTPNLFISEAAFNFVTPLQAAEMMISRTLLYHLKPQVNPANMKITKCKHRSWTRTKVKRLRRNKTRPAATTCRSNSTGHT